MRILFADTVDDARVARLAEQGHTCQVSASLDASTLPGALRGVEALVVRSTVVDAAAIEAADRLELIVRAGAGTDTIDLDAASERGIYVCNVPGQNAIAVAELAFGLLLSIDRNIAEGAADLRNGQWAKRRYSDSAGLFGRRMAVIGLGDIGLAVAERASAFGLDVIALRKPGRTTAALGRVRAAGVRFVDTMDELLGNADVVTLHVPATPDTVGLVDAEFLAKLPGGAIVLNTSRGDVIDEAALLDAMNQRGIRAGLDVFRDEPVAGATEWSSELASHPNVTGSHHIGASTRQAQEAVADAVLGVVEAYANGDVVNCVNLVERPLGACSVVVRHRDQVGVLASVLMCLRESGINVQQMQNQIFAGDGPTAAVANIRVSRPPSADVVARLEAIDAVFTVRVQSGEQ